MSKMIMKIHDIVINERGMNVCEISKTVGILVDWVQNILTTHLGMKKFAAIAHN